MKVQELVELNQMITDIKIEVRKDGCMLLDALHIGCAEGKEPRFPQQVPIDEKHMGSLTERKKAKYIDKSVNAWDDGHDYWQVKPNRIPSKWRELEVDSWEVWPASRCGNPRRDRNGNFHGQRLIIVALPSGESLEFAPVKYEKPKVLDAPEGQMSLDEWCRNSMEI